jgi:uncharacterized membrane protein YbhN (UPF0104 family)
MAVALSLLFRNVEWHAVREHLARLGIRALLVPIPAFFVLLSDTVAWRATFERPSQFPLAPLWRVRASVDAVAGSLPGGVAAGEPLRVLLLERRFGLPIAEGASNALVSRLVMALAQGVFVVCGIAMAGSPVGPRSGDPVRLMGGGLLGLAIALAFSALMGGMLVVLSRGHPLTWVLGRLQRARGARLSVTLASLRGPLERLDRGLATLTRVPRQQCAFALAMFFVGWLCLGTEGWVILRLLGAHVTVATAVSIEAIVSIVRIGFFFLPGGFGGQEAGYYGLLKLYGVPHGEAIAAAFVITKRAKEVLWVAIGYLLLLLPPLRASKQPAPLASGAKSS